MPFSIRPLRRLPLAYWSGFWSLIVLLLLSSGPAYAEWVPVDEHDQAGTTESTSYVDLDTIRRNGDLVKMWVLFDYETRQYSTLRRASRFCLASSKANPTA